MSDLMLHGVLNMPPELWGDGEIDKMQRYHRYIQASRRIEDQDGTISELLEALEDLVNHLQEEGYPCRRECELIAKAKGEE